MTDEDLAAHVKSAWSAYQEAAAPLLGDYYRAVKRATEAGLTVHDARDVAGVPRVERIHQLS